MAKIKEILPEGFKRCSKCGEVKRVEEFGKKKLNKDGFCGYCKTCYSKQRLDWFNNLTDEKKKQLYLKNNNWANSNKDWRINYRISYREANIDSVRKNEKERSKKRVINLSDSYIERTLMTCGFNKEYITPELIELERLIIKSKREIKLKTKSYEEH